MNFMLTISFSSLCAFSLAKPFKSPVSSPPAPLVPFLHLRLPDYNRVNRQPHARLAELIPIFKKSSLNLKAREDFLRTVVGDKLPD